jgi:hypothetical protein
MVGAFGVVMTDYFTSVFLQCECGEVFDEILKVDTIMITIRDLATQSTQQIVQRIMAGETGEEPKTTLESLWKEFQEEKTKIEKDKE